MQFRIQGVTAQTTTTDMIYYIWTTILYVVLCACEMSLSPE
jgi:hypothetical protein